MPNLRRKRPGDDATKPTRRGRADETGKKPRLSTEPFQEVMDGHRLQAETLAPYMPPGYVIEAAVAYLLTRHPDEQKVIMAEGLRIMKYLDTFDETQAPLMPGTYQGKDMTISPRVKHTGGKGVGNATTVDEIVDDIARKPRRRADGKKKRPKSKGAPLVGLG